MAMPDRPARGDKPELLPPNRMPRRGKGGTAANRVALLHAIAHIEYVAIDLAFDMVGRFGGRFPRAFADDWIRIGAEEAMHFALVERRLRQLGSYYGALPAHEGLWDAAGQTAHDPFARLAIVPMVLEARGLDVTPQMIERFDAVGDTASSNILRRILRDEINHVAAGVRWFEQASSGEGDSASVVWRQLLAAHFRGTLKPPFNDSARAAAGLTTDYYEPVAEPHACRPEKFPSSREGQISRRHA